GQLHDCHDGRRFFHFAGAVRPRVRFLTAGRGNGEKGIQLEGHNHVLRAASSFTLPFPLWTSVFLVRARIGACTAAKPASCDTRRPHGQSMKELGGARRAIGRVARGRASPTCTRVFTGSRASASMIARSMRTALSRPPDARAKRDFNWSHTYAS